MAGAPAHTISLASDQPLGPPVDYARERLAAALEGQGWRCVTATSFEALSTGDCALAIVLAVAPAPRSAQRLVARAGYTLPSAPEALGFCPLPADGDRPPQVLIA